MRKKASEQIPKYRKYQLMSKNLFTTSLFAGRKPLNSEII